jgi:hypothetical protein
MNAMHTLISYLILASHPGMLQLSWRSLGTQEGCGEALGPASNMQVLRGRRQGQVSKNNLALWGFSQNLQTKLFCAIF